MIKFLDTLFYIVYSIYMKWKDFDAFHHAAFVVGVLFASAVGFLLEILYLTTKQKYFKFELFPVGVMLLLIVVSFLCYYYPRKKILIKLYLDKNNTLDRSYLLYYILLILMFSTWFITPFLFKFF